MFLTVALFLIPPPVPPPPEARLRLAAEIRSKATFDQSAIEDAESAALGRTASASTQLDYPALTQAQSILARLWLNDRAILRSKAFACIDEVNGHAFEEPELRELRKFVETEVGTRLWHLAMKETVRSCFDKTASDWIGYKGLRDPLKWAAKQKRLATVITYDPATVSLVDHAAKVATQCGRRASDALTVAGGKIGFRAGWIEKNLQDDGGVTFWCIDSMSRLGGYELVVLSQ